MVESEELILGEKYKDNIHGITGIATQHCRYFTGCDRVNIEHLVNKEVKDLYIDITRLVPVSKKAKEASGITPKKREQKKAPRKGGPGNMISKPSL